MQLLAQNLKTLKPNLADPDFLFLDQNELSKNLEKPSTN